jgi:hypothetical protein
VRAARASRLRWPLAVAVALLAAPAVARASIALRVPVTLAQAPLPFLSPLPGPLPTGDRPLDTLTPADFAAPAPEGTTDPFLPPESRPAKSPPLSSRACAGLDPSACIVWGDSAVLEPSATPFVPQEASLGVGQLTAPTIGAWRRQEGAVLRWSPAAGASYYNVQVFLRRRRIVNAWPTDAALRLPPAALQQGRYYLWVVWPGFGPRGERTYGPPLGRSIFGVLLRPRITFAPAPGAPGRSVGTVRPAIPRGSLRLTGAGGARVARLDAGGRFRVDVPPDEAERLGAMLVDPGPTPPRGLERPTTP